MNTLCFHEVPESSLHQRVSQLLDSYEWCDCTFVVGSRVIKAHRLILAISSPVFKVMLYGPMTESGDIAITDMDPDIFQLMLNFIYRDKVIIDSVDIACELLYAAKKYMLSDLVGICVEHINRSVTLKSVLHIFPFVEWIQEEKLLRFCITLICRHAEYVLTKDAEHITPEALLRILQQNHINITERELIEFVAQWARDECSERSIQPTKENQRKTLIETGILPLLRFYTLGSNDVDLIGTLDILTDDERDELVKAINGKVPASEKETKRNDELKLADTTSKYLDSKTAADFQLRFPVNLTTEPRHPLRIDWKFFCRPAMRSACPLIIKSDFNTIKMSMKSKRTLFLHSLAIPTRQSEINQTHESLDQYEEQIDLSVTKTTDGQEKMSAEMRKNVNYNSFTYFDLPRHLILWEEEWYTFSFTWPNCKPQQQYRYHLSYRPTMSRDSTFVFDDNFEITMPCGGFIEGLKLCI